MQRIISNVSCCNALWRKKRMFSHNWTIVQCSTPCEGPQNTNEHIKLSCTVACHMPTSMFHNGMLWFLQYNQQDALIPQIYFWNKTLHVSNSSSVHHQASFTVHTAMVYVIQVCRVYNEKNSWWWTEELSETYRVSIQNKFEKLMYLVGFIVRVCHDARSAERKKKAYTSVSFTC